MAETLPRLEQIPVDLGLAGYTSPFTELDAERAVHQHRADGTVGLPHVIVRL